MYCVECGSEEKIYGKLCKNCLQDKIVLLTSPTHINKIICHDCGALLKGAIWGRAESQSIFDDVIKDSMTFDKIVKNAEIDVPELTNEKGEERVNCLAKLMIEDIMMEVPFSVIIRTRHQVCDMCSRRKGNYFEAIIQLRADERLPTEKEMNEGTDRINNKSEELLRTDRQAFITKIEEVKGGVDFYIGSSPAARIMARSLQRIHGATLSETSSQFGHKDGREVHRFTMLVRLPKIGKGDLVTDGNDFFLVEKVSSKTIQLKNLKNWSILSVSSNVPSKNIKSYKVLGNSSEKETAVVVSESTNDIQILDPKTMKTVEIKKPEGFKRDGEDVSVVRCDDEIFLV